MNAHAMDNILESLLFFKLEIRNEILYELTVIKLELETLEESVISKSITINKNKKKRTKKVAKECEIIRVSKNRVKIKKEREMGMEI